MEIIKPSKEQQNIVDELKNNNNVIVQAVAGSGKTTTSLFIAEQLKDKNILLIVYNKRLQQETKKRIEEKELKNISVYTFHGLATKLNKSTIKNDGSLEKFIKKNIKRKISNNLNYDLVIIDETQDMTYDYYNFVYNIVLFNIFQFNNNIQLCIFGDKKQILYEYRKANENFLLKANDLYLHYSSNTWKNCNLQTTFRMPQEITNFINYCCLNEPLLNSDKKINCKPYYYMVDNIFQAENLFSLLQKNIFEKYKEDEIAILSFSIKSPNSPIRLFANYIQTKKFNVFIPKSEQEKINPKELKGKVLFSTFHQMKGLERKVIIIFNFDNNYFKGDKSNFELNTLPNPMYVGLTRAKEKLILFHSLLKNKEENTEAFFNFLNIDNIEKYCIVNKKFKENKENLRKLKYEKNILQSELKSFSVTEILEHKNINELNQFFINFEFPTKIKTKKTLSIKVLIKNNNIINNVSIHTGVILPIYCYWKTNNLEFQSLSIFKKLKNYFFIVYKNLQTKKNFFKKLNNIENELWKFFDSIKKITNQWLQIFNVAKNSDTNILEQLHKLSVLWYSFTELKNDDIQQIQDDKYNWISKEVFNKAFEQYKKLNISKSSIIEHEVEITFDSYEILPKKHQEICKKIELKGYIDCLDLDNKVIWEFKTVNELKEEHIIQLLLYAIIYNYDKSKEEKIFDLRLYNFLTDETIKIKFSYEDELFEALKNLLQNHLLNEKKQDNYNVFKDKIKKIQKNLTFDNN